MQHKNNFVTAHRHIQYLYQRQQQNSTMKTGACNAHTKNTAIGDGRFPLFASAAAGGGGKHIASDVGFKTPPLPRHP